MAKGHSVNTIFGEFNAAHAQVLHRAYLKAAEEGVGSFDFTTLDGRTGPILTKLAKYMCEFLTSEGLLEP